MELTARTAAGADLVALAERLADDLGSRAAVHDRDGTYPHESIRSLRDAGYLVAPVPAELGGLGVSSVHDLVVASGRLARGDASVAIGEAEMTHVSRLNMKGLRDTWDADYILYSLSSGYGGSSNADRALASGEFERIAERPGLALLKRRSKTAPGSKPATPVLTAPPPPPAAPAPPSRSSAPPPPPRNVLPGPAAPLSPGGLAPRYPPREQTLPLRAAP